jgi:hypothetical protein
MEWINDQHISTEERLVWRSRLFKDESLEWANLRSRLAYDLPHLYGLAAAIRAELSEPGDPGPRPLTLRDALLADVGKHFEEQGHLPASARAKAAAILASCEILVPEDVRSLRRVSRKAASKG